MAMWVMMASTPLRPRSCPAVAEKEAGRSSSSHRLGRKDTLLDSGAINCIWNGFTMEGREKDYTFSDPYMLNAQVIVVRADSGIASQEDLAGKTVVTQVDSAAEDVLEGDVADLAATFASLDTIGEYNTAFMQLESGAVDAVACDLSIARYQMAAKPDAYVMLDECLSEENYAVGFKKGDTELAKQVTGASRRLTRTAPSSSCATSTPTRASPTTTGCCKVPPA